MQFTINVIVFLAGFAIAIFLSLHPKRARQDIHHLLGNVNYALSALRIESSHASRSVNTEEAGHGHEYLLTKDDVEQKYSSSDAWQRRAYDELKDIFLARRNRKTFPCVYATKGFRDDQHRYVFLHSDDPSEPRNIRILGESLRAYLPQADSLGANTSVVIVCPPSEGVVTMEDYRIRFWSLLRGLRIYDSQPWPENIPADVDSNKWAFCFDGKPIFPVALTPLYEKRHSRWAPNFVVALQPKSVFDKLLSTPEKRQSVTKTVRGLLKRYDSIEPSPSLTAYGDPGTSEAHQLFLFDENESKAQCPYADFDGH